MKLSEIRRHRKGSHLLPQMLRNNPLLLLGVDLPFVVVSGVSLKNGVALSIQMIFIHFVTMMVGWYVASKLEVWQRFFATSSVAVVMMLLSRELVLWMIPDIENHAGMYLYLMAVNGMTLIQSNFLAKDAAFKGVLQTALLNVLAFVGIMLGVSAVREYVGNGTLWQVPIPHFVKLTGVTAPFFGFILVGFLLGFARYLNRTLSGLLILEQVRKEQEQQ